MDKKTNKKEVVKKGKDKEEKGKDKDEEEEKEKPARKKKIVEETNVEEE